MSAREVLSRARLRQRSRVLVVDDDAEMRDALSTFLSDLGHECEGAADVATALGVIERMSLDAVKRGAFQYVTKPCDLDDLRAIVAARSSLPSPVD